MAYSIATVTDVWGKVPYSQALQGNDNRHPEFDNQEDIYDNIITLLDAAIDDFADQNATVGVGGEDFIYGGDKDKWTKAAWALKARYYNRMANQEPQPQHQYLDNVLACISKAFANNKDDMIFSAFTEDMSSANPWYQESVSKGHFAVSKTFYDMLSDLSYPIKDEFFTTINSVVTPAPNGLATEDASGTIYSKINTTLINATTPIPLMTYSELKFIEAEAEFRLNGANSKSLQAFQSALVIAVETKGMTDQIERVNYVLGQADEIEDLSIDLIIKHKYVSLWPFQPIEAFNDWRRTNIPTLLNPQSPPRRLPYPQSEIDSNPINCIDNSNALGTGVWWDDGTDD